MWLFKKKDDSKQLAKPNLEQLEDFCLECPHCHGVSTLPGLTPLSIEKCGDCGGPIFVPYKVHDYWLYQPLGGGGMGCVYKSMAAGDETTEYAVKILPRDRLNDPYLTECLLKEASIGKAFGRHPHLMYVEDYGESGGEHFSSMEFIEGQRLDQLIESSEPISQKFVMLWSLQLLSAEQRMYDAGYLYRDMKPQNIIIDGNGNIRLIDYGLCMKAEEAMKENTSESIEGSPLFMPPERIVGAGEGMTGEIYSIGMVMYNALTKSTYYSASGAFELARKHVSSVRMTSVSMKMPASVDAKVSQIIDRMIARLPCDRYLSYREAALDIKAVFEKLKD